MDKYLQQLHADIEIIILQQWNEQTPHFYEIGGDADPYLIPPKGWVEKKDDSRNNLPGFFDEEEDREEEDIEAAFEEVERFLEHSRHPRSTNMLDHFRLIAEQFPPPDRLSEEQMAALVEIIRRLWAAFNFGADIPEGIPGKIVYPLLLERMSEPTMLMKYGHCGIEFCDYNTANCPFGEGYCQCNKEDLMDTYDEDDEDYDEDDGDDFFDMDDMDELDGLLDFEDEDFNEFEDEVDWKRELDLDTDFDWENLDDKDLPF
jgi:hypothetical protein